MTEYTVDLRLSSSVITPFQSDTLFGHICWAIRYLWGNSFLEKSFLGKYPAEDAPSNDLPLMISNGFPRGYVPKPIMPPVTQNDLEGIFLQNTELKENSYKIKFIKKLDLMPISLLKSLIYDDLTPKVLFESMLREFEHLLAMDESHIWAPIRHNTVNRVKSKVEQGLFEQEECYVSPDKNVFTIYLKSNFFDKKDIKTIFDFIGENGYGKKKYTGKGHFVVHGIQEGIELPVCDEPNAYMSLSQFIPDRNDPTEGYYRLIQKYGKTGGSFAKTNPFKRPLLMLSSGSTFWGEAPKGKMITDVHYKYEQIRHYAYAFPLGLRIKENWNEND